MTLICFASQKGSPGTSAAALAVAAALRPGEGRRKLLLEADLSGGALAVRYRLPTEPGLITLAAAARAGLSDEELWRHVTELPGGLPAVVCPEGPEQVHSALAAAGAILGRHLASRRDIDVICDLGRLPPGSPAVELAAEATAVLMVARPTAEQLQPAARRMLALRPQIRNLGWLLIGEKPHGPGEVESTFGFPVVGVLADDQRSVEAIEGGAVTRRVRRHPFVRSAATVASTLSGWLSPLASPEPSAGHADDKPADQPVDPAIGQPAPVANDDLAAPVSPAPIPPPPPPPPAPEVAEVAPGPSGEPVAGIESPAPAPDPIAAAPPPTPVPLAPVPEPDGVAGPVGADAAEAAPAENGIPDLPAPPRLPSAPQAPVIPDPFVHDEDDIEWTGS